MPLVSYTTVDVFTSQRFSGNPLAVVLDARGLSDAEMQAIATEFNYAESTFVLPPENPANTARVRIFTPTIEVPFAGHPNVGTAFVLGQMAEIFGKQHDDTLRFEEAAGLVEVRLLRDGGRVTGARITAPRLLSVGDSIASDLIARCASITPAGVVATTHSPVAISVGLSFAVAELADLETLARAQPDRSAFLSAADQHPQDDTGFSLFLYVRDEENPWHYRSRMFAPLDNVPEDPATGSASAALAAYLVSLDPRPDFHATVTIEQGVEMGRRSLITLDLDKSAGATGRVSISGRCVAVMRGELEI